MDSAEDYQETVALHLEQDAVTARDHRGQQPFRFVDSLQKMDDPKLGDTTRETGEIREHHAPLLAEKIPDTAIHRCLVRTGAKTFLDQLFEAILGGSGDDALAV